MIDPTLKIGRDSNKREILEGSMTFLLLVKKDTVMCIVECLTHP